MSFKIAVVLVVTLPADEVRVDQSDGSIQQPDRKFELLILMCHSLLC